MDPQIEIVSFVKSQLLSRTEFYELYSQFDDLSGGARIESINIIDIQYEISVGGRAHFFGAFMIEGIKEVGITKNSFTGIFKGYFDELGVYLEYASLDVST
jgi:hypothetical protein